MRRGRSGEGGNEEREVWGGGEMRRGRSWGGEVWGGGNEEREVWGGGE